MLNSQDLKKPLVHIVAMRIWILSIAAASQLEMYSIGTS
jgi:hypothetical protein